MIANPPPPLTNATAVLARVARAFNTTPDALSTSNPNWVGICSDAADSSNRRIYAALAERNWTASQIAADQTLIGLASQIGVCHAMREGGLTREEAVEKLKEFCKSAEEQLELYPVLNATGIEAPAGQPVVSGGRLNYANPWARRGCCD